MIRIFEWADFINYGTCPTDRVRKEISLRLDPSKFQVFSFSHLFQPLTYESLKASENWKIQKFTKFIKKIPVVRRIDKPWKIPFISAVDIVHTPVWPEVVYLKKLLNLRNPSYKHILSLYGIPETKQTYLAGKKLARDADVVNAGTGTLREWVKKEYGVDSILLPVAGIDTKFFKPKKHHNERLKIISVGRLTEIKHPQLVVKLAEEFPQCDFSLYGAGPLRSKLERAAKKLNNFRIYQPVPHEILRDRYAMSDIIVFPGEWNGCDGNCSVVREAFACGLPVICFDPNSKFPTFIEHGKQGLMAKDFDEMKDNLRYLIENDDVRKEMGVNARKRALEIDVDKIAKQWADFYEKFIK